MTTATFDNPGGLQWHLVLSLFICWVGIALCVIRGVKSSGKVHNITIYLSLSKLLFGIKHAKNCVKGGVLHSNVPLRHHHCDGALLRVERMVSNSISNLTCQSFRIFKYV